MALSIVRISNLTTSSMQVVFNDDIDTSVGVGNVAITSTLDTIQDPDIISLIVENDTVTVTYRPIFSGVQYKVTFFSTETVPFKTINGERIIEDGNRNSKFITSPGEAANEIRDNMIENLPNVYDTEGNTLTRQLIVSMAEQLQTASDSIQTTRAGNYLSVLVEDELYTRGDGPVDKLLNGGTFEILRVSNVPTGTAKSGKIVFNSERAESFMTRPEIKTNPIISALTLDPISLQSKDIVGEIVSDDIDLNNHFVGLKIKVANYPVIQVISVSLLKPDNSYIEYDIEKFGYMLKSSRYDTNLAGTNVNLLDSEVELSASSLTGLPGGFIEPAAGDKIIISYVYKNIGINIGKDSVSLSSLQEAVRETTPAIINRFSLKHAPIVTSNDTIAVISGVEFLCTQNTELLTAFVSPHPAFVKEIPYSLTRYPAKIGEYSINYNTGEVNVFGANSDNDGTGKSPPIADYMYRRVYVNNLDYTFSSDLDEIAVNSSRSVSDIEAKITFEYEETFAEGKDFRTLSHIEVLNERVQNRLISDFRISSSNYPITNVFRLLNETTGELYSIDRFDNSNISFSGRKAPSQKDVIRERVNFVRVPQEALLISDELTNIAGLRIFKSNLQHNSIIDSQNRFIGANFDTSAAFSREDVFVREFFYEDKLDYTVFENLDKLLKVGDFIIDYLNGIVYVAVTNEHGSDIGDISYQYGEIATSNTNILDVYNIYRSFSSTSPNIKSYSVTNITNATAEPLGLEQVGQRFIADNTKRQLRVGTYQSGSDGITVSGENIFTSNSAVFTAADVGRTLILGSENQPPEQTNLIINSIINIHQVIVNNGFATTKNGREWTVVNFSPSAAKTITLDYTSMAVRNVYSASQVMSSPANELDGYFVTGRDTVSGNVITLGSSNPLQIGDPVFVDYNYGNLFVDYRYLRDELVLSYEYGNNCLDWSISDTLITGQEYYVTYRYGAMRDALLSNFGALTQIKELTTFSPNFDRETYRSIVAGTLQSFTTGPTISSIERLVESFTDVTPNIKESAFNNWVLGRDYLYLRPIRYGGDQKYDVCKFKGGLVVSDSQTIGVPALSHIKLNEGTIETWLRPKWSGAANDATLTFDLLIDGYADLSKIHIGFVGAHPSTMPFDLRVDSQEILVANTPTNIDKDTGYFIWYDDFEKIWQIRWRERNDETHSFSGTISTSGEIFEVLLPPAQDGYDGYINESNDDITSTTDSIIFNAFIDAQDQARAIGLYSMDGVSFSSGNIHYIFDMANDPSSNRISLFKDGTGFLNFQVFDNRVDHGLNAGLYNVSTNIRDWIEEQLYHIAVSWRFNSANEKDELHLFVNGLEVPNLYKYGGSPQIAEGDLFNSVAEEVLINSSSKSIVGGFDGITSVGSAIFRSDSSDFLSRGVKVGDLLYIRDNTIDGDGSPYTIIGVGTTTLLINSTLTMSLANVSFSINKAADIIVDTPVDFQKFRLVSRDAYGIDTELSGLNTEPSEHADYSISSERSYLDDVTYKITIYNGLPETCSLILQPLGLVFRRCLEKVYVYGDGYGEIRLNSSAPVHLWDVKITHILLDGNLLINSDGYTGDGYVDAINQPTDSITGRSINIHLYGSNIDYSIPSNLVTIEGTAAGLGAVSKTLIFTDDGTIKVDGYYWTTIDKISFSLIKIDANYPAGVLEVRENESVTVSENNSQIVADVVEYANGLITLEIMNDPNNTPFALVTGFYEVDYPSLLKVNVDKIPDTFKIGSDYNGENILNATIDEFRILDYMSTDTRTGEVPASGTRTVTTDYVASSEFTPDNNTLLLLHYNEDSKDSSKYIDRFGAGYEIAPSVNTSFEYGIKFSENRPYIIGNAASIFKNDEGTIEFWFSPLDDMDNDPNYHNYIDISSVIERAIESLTKTTIILESRARLIQGVYLASDTYKTGTNYFIGGSLSNVDRRTIRLGTPLPGQNTKVKVIYYSVDSEGDRLSIFKDANGFINFLIRASGTDNVLSIHVGGVEWGRHTWHRIMAMWKTNSVDNLDRMRLFVDGSERGTIKYGTGLYYGTGIIYGQAEVRPDQNKFLVNNIDMVDTFASIYVGTDELGLNGARAIIDNLRFSEIQRLDSIKTTTNDTVDINYTINTNYAVPVTEDIYTTALYNFDQGDTEIEFFATLVNQERGIFRFTVEVIDSFDKVIGNTELENLLVELINTIKPAHSEATVTFLE